MSAPEFNEPAIWPVCDCGVTFVQRRGYVFGATGSGRKWVWQPDCKHPKKESHGHVLMTADGPYVQPEDAA